MHPITLQKRCRRTFDVSDALDSSRMWRTSDSSATSGCDNGGVNEQSDFISALQAVIEVDDSARRRAEYSSDASNYRVPPLAVAFPRDKDQVRAALAIARKHGVPITSRGAGTSVAGNAVGPGLILDFSRYMNQVLSIDPQKRTARVQPGVILTDLQEATAPYGLWFGPDPSTKNRATLAGMIGNNACGSHSLAYGKTSDSVLSLDVVDGQGHEFTASSGQESVAQVPGLSSLVEQNLALLRTELGQFGRQVSGYSLEHLLPEKGYDLAKALVGSEGTCVTILEAEVALQPIPPGRTLVVLGYPDMIAAANAVPRLLPLNPLAIEGMDKRLVDIVRQHNGNVPELPEGGGWLFCEVGESERESALEAAVQLVAASGVDSPKASRIVENSDEAAALWRIRADGVGLAGRTPGGNQAWPGWEDAAVPPKNLGPYLRDFESLMDRYGVVGLPYGHFGDGCIHVRIDLPLAQQDDVPAFSAFMEDAARLVGSYGGSISGEHGDGRARGALLPHMYSDDAILLFQQFKGLFDPDGNLNPGVLVDPAPITQHLRRPAAKNLEGKGFTFPHDHGSFTAAAHRCVGVGKCRADNFAIGAFMCPSYQATKDEKDVTRGRARVLQDMTAGAFDGDWSAPEVADSLDLCLSCKACGTDCPAGVDMSTLKSEVTYRKYKGHLRPINHYVLGWLPRWARVATEVPAVASLANWALSINWLKDAVFKISRMDPRREMTAFTTQRFSRWFKKQQRVERHAGSTLDTTASESTATGAQDNRHRKTRDVILWADSFSEYLDPTGAEAMVQVLQDAGYTVRIPSSPACCGLTWISTGQLDGAKARLRKTLDVLGPAALKGVPIIGVEPSCTAVLRSDLQELLPKDPRSWAIKDKTMTLAELLTDPELGPGQEWLQARSLEGTRIIAQPHCHQHAVMGYGPDLNLMETLGAELTALAGCCGLAGNFGMEKGHYDVSVAVAENQLLPALREAGLVGSTGNIASADQTSNANATARTFYLADGYSCRTQAEQLADVKGITLPILLAQTKVR